jgi:hypothetical protein
MSPKAYEDCIATKGSKKFTKSLPDGRYVNGCKLPGSDKAVWGEVKVRQGERLKEAVK